eukprot:5224574-Amphidinium_carterae.1
MSCAVVLHVRFLWAVPTEHRSMPFDIDRGFFHYSLSSCVFAEASYTPSTFSASAQSSGVSELQVYDDMERVLGWTRWRLSSFFWPTKVERVAMIPYIAT